MDEQQKRSKGNYPPAEFWRALLALRNHAFTKLEEDYFRGDVQNRFREGTFRNSMDIVDCYLQVARDQGWLDDKPGNPL